MKWSGEYDFYVPVKILSLIHVVSQRSVHGWLRLLKGLEKTTDLCYPRLNGVTTEYQERETTIKYLRTKLKMIECLDNLNNCFVIIKL